MVDSPGRAGYEPDDRGEEADEGWGSPLPAEYGSLRTVRPDPAAAGESAPEPRPHRTTALLREGSRITSLLRRIEGAPEPSGLLKPGRTATESEAPGEIPFASPGVLAGPAAPETRAARPAAEPAFEAPAGPAAPAPPTDVAFSAAPSIDETDVTDVTDVSEAVEPGGMGAIADPDVPRRAGRSASPLINRPRRRPGRVRTRATVRHLDVASVMRISILFYLVVLLALVTASVLMWVFADVFGALPSIEKSIKTLFSLKTFVLHPSTVALYTSIFGLVLCVAGTCANVLGALIYNLIADVVGGIRVQLESLSRE